MLQKPNASNQAAVDNETLMERIQQGDSIELARLMKRLEPVVQKVIMPAVPGLKGEEMCKELLARVWLKASRYERSRGTVAAWVSGMARNAVSDAFRTQKREKRFLRLDSPESMNMLAVRAPNQIESLEARESVEQVIAKLERILNASDPQVRQAWELISDQGLTLREVGARLNRPLGTIGTWIRRIRLALLTLL